MSCLACCLLSMVVILFVSIIDSVNADPDTQARINRICADSYDYNLCRDIFNTHLFTDVTDFKGLTQIAISQTLLYSSDTLKFIQQSQSREPDKTKRDLYQICVEGYGILSNQFQDAFLQFSKGDYKSMLFDMSNCERFVDDCESVIGSSVAELHTRDHQAKVLVKMSNVSGELIGTDVA